MPIKLWIKHFGSETTPILLRKKLQMFLKDIKWQTKGNVAVGKGNFEVLVQSQGQDSFASSTFPNTIIVLGS